MIEANKPKENIIEKLKNLYDKTTESLSSISKKHEDDFRSQPHTLNEILHTIDEPNKLEGIQLTSKILKINSSIKEALEAANDEDYIDQVVSTHKDGETKYFNVRYTNPEIQNYIKQSKDFELRENYIANAIYKKFGVNVPQTELAKDSDNNLVLIKQVLSPINEKKSSEENISKEEEIKKGEIIDLLLHVEPENYLTLTENGFYRDATYLPRVYGLEYRGNKEFNYIDDVWNKFYENQNVSIHNQIELTKQAAKLKELITDEFVDTIFDSAEFDKSYTNFYKESYQKLLKEHLIDQRNILLNSFPKLTKEEIEKQEQTVSEIDKVFKQAHIENNLAKFAVYKIPGVSEFLQNKSENEILSVVNKINELTKVASINNLKIIEMENFINPDKILDDNYLGEKIENLIGFSKYNIEEKVQIVFDNAFVSADFELDLKPESYKFLRNIEPIEQDDYIFEELDENSYDITRYFNFDELVKEKIKDENDLIIYLKNESYKHPYILENILEISKDISMQQIAEIINYSSKVSTHIDKTNTSEDRLNLILKISRLNPDELKYSNEQYGNFFKILRDEELENVENLNDIDLLIKLTEGITNKSNEANAKYEEPNYFNKIPTQHHLTYSIEELQNNFKDLIAGLNKEDRIKFEESCKKAYVDMAKNNLSILNKNLKEAKKENKDYQVNQISDAIEAYKTVEKVVGLIPLETLHESVDMIIDRSDVFRSLSENIKNEKFSGTNEEKYNAYNLALLEIFEMTPLIYFENGNIERKHRSYFFENSIISDYRKIAPTLRELVKLNQEKENIDSPKQKATKIFSRILEKGQVDDIYNSASLLGKEIIESQELNNLVMSNPSVLTTLVESLYYVPKYMSYTESNSELENSRNHIISAVISSLSNECKNNFWVKWKINEAAKHLASKEINNDRRNLNYYGEINLDTYNNLKNFRLMNSLSESDMKKVINYEINRFNPINFDNDSAANFLNELSIKEMTNENFEVESIRSLISKLNSINCAGDNLSSSFLPKSIVLTTAVFDKYLSEQKNANEIKTEIVNTILTKLKDNIMQVSERLLLIEVGKLINLHEFCDQIQEFITPQVKKEISEAVTKFKNFKIHDTGIHDLTTEEAEKMKNDIIKILSI